jgi:hypothetical protein
VLEILAITSLDVVHVMVRPLSAVPEALLTDPAN